MKLPMKFSSKFNARVDYRIFPRFGLHNYKNLLRKIFYLIIFEY
jgi:hypothetical protein